VDPKKLDDVFKRIARLGAPDIQAQAVKDTAVKLLGGDPTDPSAPVASPADGPRALDQALQLLRNHVADAADQSTREFYENVLSAIARLKS
jgi:hypothetical protein